MNIFEFTLTTLETLNSNQRLHPIVKAKRTAVIRAKAFDAALATGILPMSRAHCYCYLSFGDKRRRDPGNWYPTAKAAIDGFIDAGILPDDDHLHLLGPDMRINHIGERGFLTLCFAFTEVS